MKLEFSKPPALVFVQEEYGSGFKVYLDGGLVHGVEAVTIDARIDQATECKICLIPGIKG